MSNPFMTLAHCSRFAVRKAYLTGTPQHVVATFVGFSPWTVIDDDKLLQRDDVDPADIVFTADPFEEALSIQSRAGPLWRPEPPWA